MSSALAYLLLAAGAVLLMHAAHRERARQDSVWRRRVWREQLYSPGRN